MWKLRRICMLSRLETGYILIHLDDKKPRSVHIYCTWFDIIIIFKLCGRTLLTTPSCIPSLKTRMMLYPSNKYVILVGNDVIKNLDLRLFWRNFYMLHDVNKPILKYFCKLDVDIPINARVIAVQSLKNLYIDIAAAMLVGKSVPTSPFSHMTK